MDFERDTKNNPWAQFIGIPLGNLDDLENIPVKEFPKDCANSKLLPDDMHLYGSCPVWEEFNLVSCNMCNCILIPASLMSHMELRHGTKEESAISTPSTPSTSSFVSCSSASSLRSFSSTTPTYDKGSDWTFNKNVSSGALQQPSPSVNTSANIVRVKSETSKLKDGKVQCHKLSKSSYLMLKKNMLNKKELSHTQKSVQNLPELSSNIPSTSTEILPSTSSSSSPCQTFLIAESSFDKTPEHSSVQSPQHISTLSLEKPVDCSEASTSGKKTPALEKLVLRRVLQTSDETPAVRRQSVEGVKGVARSKKDSSKEPYFMVVKDKDRQQNLLATRQQIRKQSNVVKREKDKIEQRMKKLEMRRDKLISQLFFELQCVKQKLSQCNSSKAELHQELLIVRGQYEESKRIIDQNQGIYQQNVDFQKQIKELQEKIDIMSANSSGFVDQRHMYGNGTCISQVCNCPNDQLLKQLHTSEESKFHVQKRLEEVESELSELKQSSLTDRRHLEYKLKQYFRVITELRRRLDAQATATEEIRMKKAFLEQHIPEEVLFQIRNQMEPQQSDIYEIYPNLMASQSNIPAPAVPYAEKLLADIKSIDFRTFQHQVSSDRNEMFQQNNCMAEEDVS